MREPQAGKIVNDDECSEIVRKKLEQDSLGQYSLVSYAVEPLSAVSGFMGQYFKLRARVASGPEERSIEFFAKLPPSADSPQHDFNREMGSFSKEVALYTRVFPELLLAGPRCVPRCVPRCFLGLDALIVLEDMAHDGFLMPDKFVPFDFQHCETLVRTIAKFHASSIIFEENGNKSLHELFAHAMRETLFPMDRNRAVTMFRAAVKGLLSLADLLTELDEEQRRKFKDKITELSQNHAEQLLPSKKYKNVLCHGDLWANNILFKYDSDKKPTDCCLIDFQLARYNPPVHDILCFLQFSTTRELRSARLGELLRSYHSSLSLSLEEASLDAAALFPWRQLESSADELRVMHMMHGLLNTPIMLLDDEAVGRYFVSEPGQLEQLLYADRTPLVTRQFRRSPAYRHRITDSLLELHQHLFP